MAKVIAENFSDSELNTVLTARRCERYALLERLKSLLENDKRIAAAWIMESFDGEEDDLSGIALQVVIYNEYMSEFCNIQYDYIRQIGEVILYKDIIQNETVIDLYLTVLYEGYYGPQQVNYLWISSSNASIPQDATVIINRANIDRVGESCYSQSVATSDNPLDTIVQMVNRFWVAQISDAVRIARFPETRDMALFNPQFKLLKDVKSFVKKETVYNIDNIRMNNHPVQHLRILRDLGKEMMPLMSAVEAQGSEMPWGIIPASIRFITLIETIVTTRAM